MNTPFFNQMAAIAARGPRFFVPGHKGNPAAIAPFGPLLQYDLTEVDGADDLSCPTGPLAESQANMAAVFGSGATLYSASGASSCILAMISLFCGADGRLVIARGCHISAVRALALLNIEPSWVPLQNGYPHPQSIERALAQSGAKTVYITSPDYYGRIADIAEISAVCRRYGANLLVDNAQGAHLRFLRPSAHPLQLGASATADSAHKTMPCLTPAALLHLSNAALATQARAALNMFCSTSPSYIVLQSLDLAAGSFLQKPPNYSAAAEQLAKAGAALSGAVQPCDDALRLVLRFGLVGADAAQCMSFLLQEGIAPEYFDGETAVFMASPFNTPQDFSRLAATLADLRRRVEAGQFAAVRQKPALPPLPPPKVAMPIRQALFAPHHSLPTLKAVGRIMGSLSAPCPPGVPLVLPGEEISPEWAQLLAAGGILQVDVVQ